VATGFTAANNNDLIGPMSGSIKTATVAVTGSTAANFVVKLSYTGGTVDPGVFTYDAAAGLSGPAGS
jgi:hypothetical protein